MVMKAPADRREQRDPCTDLPIRTHLRYGLQWKLVLLVATALGAVSSVLAWQFTLALGRSLAYWQSLVVLNVGYWYVWALFTPGIVWLSQHFRFERRGLWRAFAVHLPAVCLFAFGHIAAMSGIQLWLATLAGKPFLWWQDVQRSTLQ